MLIYGFNEACKNIASGFLKVGDESRSAICFRTKVEGNLTHLSYIYYNLEPLEKYFKTLACSVTGESLFIDIQRGNEGKDNSK